MTARIGREGDRQEDAQEVLFALQRPNEEKIQQKGERDIRDRPEGDQVVAIGLKKGERLGKARGHSCEQRGR